MRHGGGITTCKSGTYVAAWLLQAVPLYVVHRKGRSLNPLSVNQSSILKATSRCHITTGVEPRCPLSTKWHRGGCKPVRRQVNWTDFEELCLRVTKFIRHRMILALPTSAPLVPPGLLPALLLQVQPMLALSPAQHHVHLDEVVQLLSH